MKGKALALFFLTILTGCGYHLQKSRTAVFVPYIEGDSLGLLTSALEYQVAASPVFYLSEAGAPLQVKVEEKTQVIGYQRDIEGSSQNDRLLPNEAKRMATAIVTFNKTHFRVESAVCFDFIDSDALQDVTFFLDGSRLSTLQFSLGQLDSREGAFANASQALYTKLSEKIVDKLLFLQIRDQGPCTMQ